MTSPQEIPWSFSRSIRGRAEKYPLARNEVEDVLRDPCPRMSATAMVYLSLAYPEETTDILRKALLSPNPRHREYALDQIGDRGVKELKDEVVAALTDEHPDVRDAAAANLELLEVS